MNSFGWIMLSLVTWRTVDEMGARARVIWLRVAGNGDLVWRRAATLLRINIALLRCLKLASAWCATIFGKTGLRHYPLLIIAYDGYCNLWARVLAGLAVQNIHQRTFHRGWLAG